MRLPSGAKATERTAAHVTLELGRQAPRAGIP
jgi:hypothetical protein